MEIGKAEGGPLQGVKVADLSHVQAGPTCTMMLGDMGADVIKVESFSGDQFRVTMDGYNFVNLNRNKRGIALNLKKEEGKEVVLKLVRKADVFVENFLPGSIDRLGLGYDTVSHLNPRIVYCSISGFGQTGPYRDRPAYDPVLQAMSGIMVTTGDPDRLPSRIRPAMIDHCAAMNAAFAIVVSLMNREKTGRGERIDIALLDVAISPMSPYVTQYKKTGELPQRAGSAHPGVVPFQNFEASDGLIHIGAPTDEMWKNLCKVLESEHLAKDPRYATRSARVQHRKELTEDLNRVTQEYTCQELESKLLPMGIPCGKLRTIGELVEEPYLHARGIFEEVYYPPMGKVLTVKTPVLYSGRTAPTRLRAPLLGEHTKEVLKELGYGDTEIQELIREGVALQYEP